MDNSVSSAPATLASKNSQLVTPKIQSSKTNDGLSIKCVPLVSFEMKPTKFEELDFLESDKQAKQLLKKYTATAAKSLIETERKELGKEAPKDITAAIGSEEEIYAIKGADCGMFAAVFTAYSHHYKLRTSADDWWFCIVKQVARALYSNSRSKSVRNMFVSHEGKKTIAVLSYERSIYSQNYSSFFDQITKKIKENIKVPEFVDGITADFSTTSPVQKIVSQVTLINSVSRFFRLGVLLGCGIPAVEMLGTEEDWAKLTSKLKILRTLLEPIQNELGLSSKWWDMVRTVFCKLLETYQGKPDETWWSHIIDYQKEYASGIYLTGRNIITGWITEFLEHEPGSRCIVNPEGFESGLVSLPLTITDVISGEQDTGALVAGMLGFTVHRTDTCDDVIVQPFQGWSLMLASDSPLL